ncbi:hypothetical protein JCM8208_003236 [Rhodotorula glutinis]
MTLQAPSPWRPPPEWDTSLRKSRSQQSLGRPSPSAKVVPSSDSSSPSSSRRSSPLGSARSLSHLFSSSGSVASFFSTISSLTSSSSTPSDEDSPDATKSAPSRLSSRHPKRPAMFVRRSTSALATLPTLSSRPHQHGHGQQQQQQQAREAQQQKRASAPPGCELAASAATAGLSVSTMGGELSNWMDAVALAGRQAQASRDDHEPGGS